MSVLLVWICLGGLTLAAVTGAYLLLYRRHIRQAMAEPWEPRRPWPSPRRVLILGLVLLLLLFLLFVLWERASTRITTLEQIEEQFFQSSGSYSGWDTTITANDDLAVFLAWSPDHTHHSYRIYRNLGDRIPDYRFRYGGKTVSIEENLCVFFYRDSMILLSTNTLNIAQLRLADGTVYPLTPGQPFALLLPRQEFDLFDPQGSPIDPADHNYFRQEEIS